MDILIWRHGKSETASSSGIDAERKLTPEGENDVRRIARQIKESGFAAEIILTSPLLRAVQTAAIIRETLDCRRQTKTTNDLLPGVSSKKIILSLKEMSRESHSIVLVGHMPDLGLLAAKLTADSTHNVSLKAGSMIAIKVENFEEPLRGEVVFALSP